jgi:cysteine desulfuration protein SufE
MIDAQKKLIENFLHFPSLDEKYEKIIDMGRGLSPLTPEARVEKNLVQGCQSILYLETSYKDGLIYFNADSEALISKGLAALLIYVYSGKPPEILFKEPPHFLKEIGLHQALSPTRSNGLSSLYRKMQQEALKIISGRDTE